MQENNDALYKNIVKTLKLDTLEHKEQQIILASILDLIIKQCVIIAHDRLPIEAQPHFVDAIEKGRGDMNILIAAMSQEKEGVSVLNQAIQEVLEGIQ